MSLSVLSKVSQVRWIIQRLLMQGIVISLRQSYTIKRISYLQMKLFQRLQNAIKKTSFFYHKSLSSKIALRKWHLENLINWSKHSILFLLSIGVRWFKFQIFIMTHSFQAAQFQVKHFQRLQNAIKKTSFYYDKSLSSKMALREPNKLVKAFNFVFTQYRSALV